MNDDFLITCEKLWKLSEDGKMPDARRETTDAGEDAIHDLAHRIDLNHVKRRLLLMRVQDLAQAGA